jgi:hypothetical protein
MAGRAEDTITRAQADASRSILLYHVPDKYHSKLSRDDFDDVAKTLTPDYGLKTGATEYMLIDILYRLLDSI